MDLVIGGTQGSIDGLGIARGDRQCDSFGCADRAVADSFDVFVSDRPRVEIPGIPGVLLIFAKWILSAPVGM